MRVSRSLSFLNVILIAFSCGQALPKLDGIDQEGWKQDKDGCTAFRKSMSAAIAVEKEKLKRLSEMQVMAMLGKPDENSLFTRNQKFYHYYLDPGPDCGGSNLNARKLVLRFNAIGIVKETLIE